MKKVLNLILCAVIAVASAGCATITITSPGMLEGIKFKGTKGTPTQLIFIEGTCYSLFRVIPLWSGDIRWNSETKSINGRFRPLENHVSLDNIQKAITNYASSHNCDVVDIVFNNIDTSYADAGENGLLWSMFNSSAMTVSAVLVPKPNYMRGR